MKYIFHISDIHIDIDREENIFNSFNVLISDIIKKGLMNSMLVIIGDIFENKTILTTTELNIFDRLMNLLFSAKIKTIIVVGNHDFNINSCITNNKISLEILTKSYNNITCLTHTQVYNIENIDFYVYSIVDNKIPEQINNSKNIKIALYHGGINGAKYDNGTIIQGERFNVNDFDIYDYTMLGDIHKPQFLSDKIAYSGSLVQKNKGEGLDHGYILWDLIGKKSKHIFIPLKNLMIKIIAYNNKCTVPVILPGQKIIYVQLLYKNCKKEYIDNLIKKIKDKFGFLNKIVDNTSSELIHTETINTETKIKFTQINHNECIRELLKDKKPDEIEAYINYHNEQLQQMKDVNHVSYRINYLMWDNVFCYGEGNYINFSDFSKSIVILNGKNKYGKSSIIDILIRILFNECDRGYKKDIVNKNKKSGFIKISLSVPSGSIIENGERIVKYDEYIIEQVLYKIGVDTRHRLYKNGKNITQSDIGKTYTYIKEVIGIGCYKDFIYMTTALQNRKFLVDMKEDDILNLLIKLLNIDMLENINKQVNKEYRIINHDISTKTDELYKVKEDINSVIKMIDLIKSDNKEDIIDIKDRITEYNLQLQDLNKKLTIDMELSDINDKIIQLKKILKSINLKFKDGIDTTKLNRYKTQLAVLRSKLEKYKKHDCKNTNENSISETEYNNLIEICNEIRLIIKKPDKILSADEINKIKSDAISLYSGKKYKISEIEEKIKQNYNLLKPTKMTEDEMILQIKNIVNNNTYNPKNLSNLDDLLQSLQSKKNRLNKTDLVKTNLNISAETYNQYMSEIAVFKVRTCKIKKNANNEKLEQEIRKRIAAISSGISGLSGRVFAKKAIIPNNIESGILKNEANYRREVDAGLPNYAALNTELNELNSKIKKFTESYGDLNFAEKCDCCVKNKQILLDSDKSQIAKINKILEHKEIKEKKFNEYKNYLDQIDTYRKNKELNEIAKSNNLEFEKLQKLISEKNDYENICQKILDTKIYEKIFKTNSEISEILFIEKVKELILEKNNLDKNKKIKSEIKILEQILENIKLEKLIEEAELYNSNNKKLNENLTKIQNYETTQRLFIQLEINDLNTIIVKEEKYINDFNNYALLKKLLYNRKIMEEISKIKKHLNIAENNLTKNTEKINELSKLNQTRENLDKQLIEIEGKIKTYQERALFLKDYQRCVDKKKGISQSILQKLCEYLNCSCNKILKEIADFEIEIAYDKKGILRVYTKETGMIIPASMSSGYQKFVMDMIMRIVLTTALCNNGSNNISDPNILIIDEGFGCLDKKNFIEVAGTLNKLKHNFRCMIIITHIDELKSYADNIININRIKNESNITYGNIKQHRSSKINKSLDEIADFNNRLDESRAEINDKQNEKALVKKKIKEEKELAKKQKEEEKKENKRKLDTIMNSYDKMKEYLIYSFKDDEGIDRFKCKICESKNSKYGIRESSIDSHIKSTTYKAKHKKYIKSIIS
jgi:DNA repair exonuclease SbcCD ATPase subunit